MDLEKIKSLRNKIAIPLDVAIELLKKHNDDISICEQEFHNNNIKEICKTTDCDQATARRNYISCNYDKIKTIEKINTRQIIISTQKTELPKNEIGFILWPENSDGENYKTTKRNDAFIPTADFNYIIENFRSVFPLKNPWNNNVEEQFDVCGHNYIDNETCKQIIKKIANIKNDDKSISQFLQEVTQWFNEKLEYADFIVIYGNL